jgi:hypothetical protein
LIIIIIFFLLRTTFPEAGRTGGCRAEQGAGAGGLLLLLRASARLHRQCVRYNGTLWFRCSLHMLTQLANKMRR